MNAYYALVAFLLFYIIWLIIMIIMACPKLKTASQRKRIMVFFNISMLIMTMIGIIAGGF